MCASLATKITHKASASVTINFKGKLITIYTLARQDSVLLNRATNVALQLARQASDGCKGSGRRVLRRFGRVVDDG